MVATPGALVRYRQQGQLFGPLTRQLITGTLPGVALGSAIHVYFAAGPRAFRLLAAAVLLSLGVWLLVREYKPTRPATRAPLASRAIMALAPLVGVIGGIYGIGGGSILAPILVGSGMSVASVAPAALASTCITSLAGAMTYAALALTTHQAFLPTAMGGLKT